MASTENLRIILTAVDKATGVLKGVSNSIKNTQKSLDKATGGAKKFTKTVGLMAGIGGGLAVKEFMSFEKQMSGVKAVMGANTEEFKKLTKLAKKMGATTAFTGTQAAGGIEMLGKNGLTTSQILGGALKNSMDLASAGAVDLSTAADISTDVMNLWKIKASDMGTAVNGITGVMQTSKFSVDDFRLALAQGGGVAATVGVSFNDFTTTMSGISSKFASGSDAGTAFKVMLQRLVPNGKPATAMMKKLGIITEDGGNRFFTASGKMKKMSEISQILKETTGSLSDEQKINALSTMFGTDAMRAAAGVADMGADKFNKLSEKIQKVDAGAVVKTRLDNLAGSFTLLKSAISGAMIEIGGAISEYLRPAMDWLTEKISTWRTDWENLSPTMQAVIKNVGLIAGGITALVLVIGTISLVLTPVIAAFGVLTGVLSTLGTVLGFIGGAFTAVGLPIIAIIAAVIALGVAIYELYTHWDEVMKWLKETTSKMGEWISKVWEDLKASVSEIMGALGDWIINKWNGIKDFFNTVFGFIKGIFTSYINFYKNLVIGGFNLIKNIIVGVFNFIKGFITTSFNFIKNGFSTSLNFLKDIVSTAFNFIKNIFVNAFNNIKNILVGAFKFIKAIFTGDFQYIKDTVNRGFTNIKNSFTNGLSFIKNLWSNSLNLIKNVGSNAWNSIKGFVGGAMDSMTKKFTGFYNKVSGIYNKVKGWLGAIFGAETKAQQSANNIRRVANTTGAGSLDGARAIGGPVTRNKTYLVGENGPEYFTPGTSGRITPNGGTGGGGNAPINLYFGDVHLNNGDDEASFFEKVKNVMIEVQRNSTNNLA